MRKSIERNIINQISSKGLFRHYDFNISDSFKGIEISYEYTNDDYSFSFKLPTTTKKVEIEAPATKTRKNDITKPIREFYEFSGYMRPGKYGDHESFTVETFEEVMKKMSDWLDYLNEELMDFHLYRQFKKQDAKIDEIKQKIEEHFKAQNDKAEAEDEYLTREEAEELIKRLNEMEALIKNHISDNFEKESERNAEIEKLHTDFEDFRNSTTYLNKSNWFKKFFVSVASWSFDPENKKRLLYGTSIFLKIGKYFGLSIPEGVLQLLPPEKE